MNIVIYNYNSFLLDKIIEKKHYILYEMWYMIDIKI